MPFFFVLARLDKPLPQAMHLCSSDTFGVSRGTGLPALSSQANLQPSAKPVHPQKKSFFYFFLMRRNGLAQSGQGCVSTLIASPFSFTPATSPAM